MASTVGDFELLRGSSTPLLAVGDILRFVDVSDSTQAPQGSLVSATVANYFAAIPTPIVITSASATAFAVGLNGATNPAFAVDASTALQVAGLKVKGAVTTGTVAVVVTDSGAVNTNLTINALNAGTIGIGSVSTGRVTITPVVTITGALTQTGLATFNGGVTVASGQTLTVTGATITGLTAASVATGTFPGVYTITGALTLSSTGLVYDGKTLTGSTGTGNMVLSASPTFTGTLTAAIVAIGTNPASTGSLRLPSDGKIVGRNQTNNGDITLIYSHTDLVQIDPDAHGTAMQGTLIVQGAVTFPAALTYGGVTLSNAVTGTGNMVLSAGPTFTGTAAFATVTASSTINGQTISSTANFTGTATFAGVVQVPATVGLAFGGTTSSFVALSRSTTSLLARLADNSDYCDFQARKISAGGSLVLDTVAAASNGANTVTLGATVQTTIGANGGASALTANPLGYLKAFVGTTAVIIPYYNA